jgi:hypothetical protein
VRVQVEAKFRARADVAVFSGMDRRYRVRHLLHADVLRAAARARRQLPVDPARRGVGEECGGSGGLIKGES